MRFYPWSFFAKIKKSPLIRKALRRGVAIVLTLVVAAGVSLWVASARTGMPVRGILAMLIDLSRSRDSIAPYEVDNDIGSIRKGDEGKEWPAGPERGETGVEPKVPEDEDEAKAPAKNEAPAKPVRDQPDTGGTRDAGGGSNIASSGNEDRESPNGGATASPTSEGATVSSTTGGATASPTTMEAVAVPHFKDLVSPVEGEVVTEFGWVYFPTFKDWRFHPGLDFKAGKGEPVKAVSDGTILAIEEDPFKGLVVTQSYESTDAVIRYAGLTKPVVRAGDTVRAGEVLAEVGDPGLWEAEWGLHVHVEVRPSMEGEVIDPTGLFR